MSGNEQDIPEGMRQEDFEVCTSIINDNPVCYENEFKRFLLPLLKEGATAKDRDRWLRIAGNSRMPVNVAKDGDLKTILFTVPPIDIRPKINKVPMGMYEAVSEAQRLGDVHPMKGKQFATRLYGSLLGDLEMPEEDIERWTYIFDTYIGVTEKTKSKEKEDLTEMFDDSDELYDW